MSVLVVGVSHASASVATLERAVISGDAQVKLLHDMRQSENVAGALVLSTCNRVEIYAEVDRFHGGVATMCELLARHSGLPLSELTSAAYVHYQERAVQHLLSVACGLESMVVGESQILGQVRQAAALARQHGTLSRELSDLSRLALRVGKRARSDTRIDAAGQNLVTLGLDMASMLLTGEQGKGGAPAGCSVLVVGAGSMSSLAVATATRQGAGWIVVANRTRANAEKLAHRYAADVADVADLVACIAAADLVITCTGAVGQVITEAMVTEALALRRSGTGGQPAARGTLVFLDLALPRDIETGAGRLPGVRLIDLATLGAVGSGPVGSGPVGSGAVGSGAVGSGTALAAGAQVASLASDADVAAVRRIVAHELAEYLKADRALSVAPTVVALRAKAATVVESELARLERRLGVLDGRVRREIAHSMGRIADKLLHAPTVRVKELAGSPGADSYEAALRVLFELDLDAVQAVGRPSDDVLTWQSREQLREQAQEDSQQAQEDSQQAQEDKQEDTQEDDTREAGQ
jgi:glutamyl-tRNA reductase